MRLFDRRRRQGRTVPSYSNEAVIQRIQRDAGVDRETARAWFNEVGQMDPAVWAVPVVGGAAVASETRGGDDSGDRGSLGDAGGSLWDGGSFGGDSGGGSGCGGGGG
jgi:hypothetical protein